MTERTFYVYEHWRPDRGECFYVGKGHAQRAQDMRRGRSRYHKFVQSKLSAMGLDVEIRIIADQLTEGAAFAMEIERIAYWRAIGVALVNLTDGGEGTSGRKHTDEWKKATSERQKGRKCSEEHKQRVREFHTGKQWGLGYKKTPEQIEKTVRAVRGVPKSAETRAKIRATKLANPRRLTEAEKAHLREVNKGKIMSEEARAKMSEATKGKPKSAEHRAKLREISLAQWADKRAKAAQQGEAA